MGILYIECVSFSDTFTFCYKILNKIYEVCKVISTESADVAAISSANAYSGTYAVGKAEIAYYTEGKSKEETQKVMKATKNSKQEELIKLQKVTIILVTENRTVSNRNYKK